MTYRTNVVKFFINVLLRIVVFGRMVVHRVRVGQRIQTLFGTSFQVQVLYDQLQYFRQRLEKITDVGDTRTQRAQL